MEVEIFTKYDLKWVPFCGGRCLFFLRNCMNPITRDFILLSTRLSMSSESSIPILTDSLVNIWYQVKELQNRKVLTINILCLCLVYYRCNTGIVFKSKPVINNYVQISGFFTQGQSNTIKLQCRAVWHNPCGSKQH